MKKKPFVWLVVTVLTLNILSCGGQVPLISVTSSPTPDQTNPQIHSPLSTSVSNIGPTPTLVSSMCNVPPPELLSPTQGATSYNLHLPKFIFSAVTGITDYIYQIALDEIFTSPIDSQPVIFNPNDSFIVHWSGTSLLPETTYYWRVASVCANGNIGQFSQPKTFRTLQSLGESCKLPPPTLISPANRSKVSTLIPELIFSTVPNGNEYSLEMYRNTEDTYYVDWFGVRPEYDASVVEQPYSNLEPGATYYWRVATNCADQDTEGDFSSPFSFTVEDSLLELVPDTSTLLWPQDGSTVGSIRVLFEYTKVTNATDYIVYVDPVEESIEGDKLKPHFELPSEENALIYVFNPNSTYEWYVCGGNEIGWGGCSVTQTFTTPIDIITADITPTDGGSLVSDAGFLTLQFRPHAVRDGTNLRLNTIAVPTHSIEDFHFANHAFVLEAAQGSVPLNSFNNPYTMILKYNESDLKSAGINDASQLNLYFWDGTTWQGIMPCEDCSNNTSTSTITVVLDYFAEFALLIPNMP